MIVITEIGDFWLLNDAMVILCVHLPEWDAFATNYVKVT